MVACDNGMCPYEWFHFECVNLQEIPKGGWYCQECDPQKKKNDEKKLKTAVEKEEKKDPKIREL